MRDDGLKKYLEHNTLTSAAEDSRQPDGQTISEELQQIGSERHKTGTRWEGERENQDTGRDLCSAVAGNRLIDDDDDLQ